MFRLALLLGCASAVSRLQNLNAASPPPVTVLIQTPQVFSSEARLAMEEESDRIVRSAGLRVQFLEQARAAGQEFQELVLFRFSGKCTMDAWPEKQLSGPYASAAVQGSNVLPFGEVHCNRIREAIKSAMAGKDFQNADALLGRALGRVVAHELYHILANTKRHGRAGVMRDSLSPRQLLADELDLAEHESGTLRDRADFR